MENEILGVRVTWEPVHNASFCELFLLHTISSAFMMTSHLDKRRIFSQAPSFSLADGAIQLCLALICKQHTLKIYFYIRFIPGNRFGKIHRLQKTIKCSNRLSMRYLGNLGAFGALMIANYYFLSFIGHLRVTCKEFVIIA